MRRYLCILLIFGHVVSAIAPAQSSRSVILNKRVDAFCSEFYGNPILSDCRAARNKILHWEYFHRPTSPDALTFLAGAFEFLTMNSRHNPVYGSMPRAYLPAFFKSGDCEVALYMREGITELDSAMNVYGAADQVASNCVEAKSWGGYTAIGMHHDIGLYMYATDSDYLRLRERRDSCAQASSSGQSSFECSNLQDPPGQSGSTGTEPAPSAQGTSPSTCSKGYATQTGDCCQNYIATWSLLVASKASLILGVRSSLGGDLISWCQESLHS